MKLSAVARRWGRTPWCWQPSALRAPCCCLRPCLPTSVSVRHPRRQVLDACLKEIATALLQADVNVRLVANLRNNVKKRVNMEQLASGLNKQKVIEKVGVGAACGLPRRWCRALLVGC